MPVGFHAEVFSDDVPGARSLALGPKGTVFVGTRDEGTVYALRDEDGDGHAEKVLRVATGLDTPNGVAVRGGALYVAENSRILRYVAIEDDLVDGGSPPHPRADSRPANPRKSSKNTSERRKRRASSR